MPRIDESVDVTKALNNYVEIPVENQPEENVPFVLIEDAPVYKGCEGLFKEKNKECFVKSIKKFVMNGFDIDFAQELGLSSGTYKRVAQFIITKDGSVNELKIITQHSKLEKNVKIIIKKLPRFTPGMQRKVPVNVKFTLPILFKLG